MKKLLTCERCEEILEMINELGIRCKICKSKEDLRFGHCFDCAEIESIIVDGNDMYDKGLDGKEVPAKTGLEKVKLLWQKGYLKSSETNTDKP